MPWRRKWQPTSVFLPGKAHGQRRLEGYNPLGCKESEMTYQLNSNNYRCGKKEQEGTISSGLGPRPPFPPHPIQRL